MATPKKTTAPKRTASPARPSSAPPKAPSPKNLVAKNLATSIKPVRTIPSGPVPHSKTLANGQPRPKSRRSK